MTPPIDHEHRLSHTALDPPPKLRILGRRYALTPTSYKYLEIGISVRAMFCVQLVLGDNRDNQILLKTSQPPLQIRDLTFKVVKISDSDIIKMTLYNNSLYMNLFTLIHLFDFEKFIEHIYY
ncbi:hypothetical protein ACFW04_013918 [Cataglyphis niger]